MTENNSNSKLVHTLIMCEKEEFEGFKTGTYKLQIQLHKLISITELKKTYEEEKCIVPFNNWMNLNHELYTFKEYMNIGFEYFEKEYTTKCSSKIIAFGKYGLPK